MLPSRLDFRSLKSRVHIEHVLAQRGLLSAMQQRGEKLVGPCPIHRGDSSAAFVVSRTKNLWYCFTRCQRGGDVVELVRLLDGSSYREVARYLAALDTASEPRPAHTTRAFKPFTAALHLDPVAPFLQAKQIGAETAQRFETGLYRGRGFLEGCVAVRLHDPSGAPLGYAGRRLDPDRARQWGKWKLPARLPKRSLLFNYHRVRHQLDRGVAIVEDPWSVMRLAQIGVPAVALLGASLSAEQQRLLAPAPAVLLLLDGDEAGHIASATLRARLAPRARVTVVDLPPRIDPDQLSNLELACCAEPLTLLPTSL